MSRLAFIGLVLAVALAGLGLGWLAIRTPGAILAQANAATVADGDLKPVLQARYDAMEAAMTAHDMPAIAAMLAPGFTSVDRNGRTQTGPQMLAQAAGLRLDPNRKTYTALFGVKTYADTAVVKQMYDMKLDKKGPDGALHNVEISTVSTDAWIRRQGQWLLQQSTTDEVSVYRDGGLVARQ